MYKGKGERELIVGTLEALSSMYIHTVSCVRVKGDESEDFIIDRAVRQDCIMSLWLFKVYMNAVMKELKIGMGVRF